MSPFPSMKIHPCLFLCVCVSYKDSIEQKVSNHFETQKLERNCGDCLATGTEKYLVSETLMSLKCERKQMYRSK